jgi:SAM-dependent methyltransferase
MLDVGCGDGLFFDRLERFGEVEGLEPDASLLTRTRWGSQIRVGAIGEGVDWSGEFDLVLMLDVLEHMTDEMNALRSARALIRPGGHLLLTVPALPWLWSRHDEVNEHHRRYNRGALRDRLITAGFRVETARYFFFWTVAPLLLRRWLAPARDGTGSLGRDTGSYSVRIPPMPINRVLTWISEGEHALGNLIRWPVGGSLLAVAQA